MSDRLPDFIDPMRLAEQGKRIKGPLKLDRLSRLAALLSSHDGDAEVELRFGFGNDGVAAVRGNIGARLEMICQRCMQPVEFDIETTTQLGIVKGEREAELLPTDYDPLLVGNDPVYFADLVEDELILALPIAPMHEQSDCVAWVPQEPVTEAEEEQQNPFSVLADLKNTPDDEIK